MLRTLEDLISLANLDILKGILMHFKHTLHDTALIIKKYTCYFKMVPLKVRPPVAVSQV